MGVHERFIPSIRAPNASNCSVAAMTLTRLTKPWTRNVVQVVPMGMTHQFSVAVDRTHDRLRNLVERRFIRLKNARRVATR